VKWRTFEKARMFARSLGLEGTKAWERYCVSGKKPDDIPSNPQKVYKDKYNGSGDWLGTGRVAHINRQWRAFEEAREFIRRLGLASNPKWREYCKAGKKPDDIPSNPDRIYEDEWRGWKDWLGTKLMSFEEARAFIHALHLPDGMTPLKRVWATYVKSGRKPDYIPSVPSAVYDEKWKGLTDWLGVTGERHRPFEEAREFVRALELRKQSEWNNYLRSGKRPKDIPAHPERVYASQWIGLGDWLGSSILAHKNGKWQWRPFEDAREFVRSLSLSGTKAWKEYSGSDKPDDIPSAPYDVYEEWKGFGDWLGTGRKSRGESWRPFEEARKYVRALNLPGTDDWYKYCASGERPADIPSSPSLAYGEQWTNFGDWLGTGRSRDKQWRPFAEAREFVRTLNITGKNKWEAFCKSGNKPDDMPTNPQTVYNSEWHSWGDWLGTGRLANHGRQYRAFAEARKFAHDLDLSGQDEWFSYCKSGKKPIDIPIVPARAYPNDWKGMADWLGTRNIRKHWRPFAEARDLVHSLNLTNAKQWEEYAKSGQKPGDIPARPAKAYKDDWQSWGDWLGTGRVSTRLEYEAKRQRLVEAITSIKDSLDWLPLSAWWYILLQSGIEPSTRHARLLRANQNGKLSLEELIDAIFGDEDVDDEDDLFQKFKKPDSVKILKLLESPIVAGMDSEAIAAIMAELKSQLWERIYENEDAEIEKLKGAKLSRYKVTIEEVPCNNDLKDGARQHAYKAVSS
jgi:hypothetical protein